MAKSGVQYVCSECGWNGRSGTAVAPSVVSGARSRNSRGSAGGRLSHGRSRPNITHAVGYGCQQRQICSPSDYRSGHGKRRAARYRVFRIRPCARRWRGAGFSNADSGRTGYRQVDIAVADGRQYRARCGGRQYVPRGRSAVCQTVGPGAGQRIEHGADAGQRIINTRQHRAVHFRRGITGAGSFARFPASMRWSRTCYWPPPPTCPQYWG